MTADVSVIWRRAARRQEISAAPPRPCVPASYPEYMHAANYGACSLKAGTGTTRSVVISNQLIHFAGAERLQHAGLLRQENSRNFAPIAVEPQLASPSISGAKQHNMVVADGFNAGGIRFLSRPRPYGGLRCPFAGHGERAIRIPRAPTGVDLDLPADNGPALNFPEEGCPARARRAAEAQEWPPLRTKVCTVRRWVRMRS